MGEQAATQKTYPALHLFSASSYKCAITTCFLHGPVVDCVGLHVQH